MSSNTRQARRDAIEKRKRYFDNYISMLCMLYDNSVVVENDSVPKRYLLKILREKGGIAYDKETKLYLPYVEKGIDAYGLPQDYTLVGANGYVLNRKPSEVVILRSNDLKYAILNYFEQQVEKIVDIDCSIEQNLDACKTMTIAELDNDSALLSLANEVESRRVGATIIFKNKNAMQGTELKVSNTGATYLVDKLLDARKEILNETLSTIGISVANTDKKERVQSIEVLASQGYALDCINTLVETFNYDAEQGGLSIRLKANTSLVKENEKANEKGDENE